VAGPRASKDPNIYEDTKTLLRAVLNLDLPHTVTEAVDRLISELALSDKIDIAERSQEELLPLHFSLGLYIRNNFGLWSGNSELIESCLSFTEEDRLHEDDATALIIMELWKRLRETHSMRAIK